MKKSTLTFLALAVSVLFSAETFARDQINIVGSSTVYPYGTVNAQRLGESGFKTPTYNPIGTGGGMKKFQSWHHHQPQEQEMHLMVK